jgi:hypothetical protein
MSSRACRRGSRSEGLVRIDGPQGLVTRALRVELDGDRPRDGLIPKGGLPEKAVALHRPEGSLDRRAPDPGAVSQVVNEPVEVLLR